jgi:diguanylate cyclase (GGDEF)-like protein
MRSLYQFLLAEYPRQLTPIRCSQSTIAQLHRSFEDVVIENRLDAFVVETLPATLEPSGREIERLLELALTARDLFVLTDKGDPLASLPGRSNQTKKPAVISWVSDNGSLILIASRQFSAVLASMKTEPHDSAAGDLVVWTFDPKAVHSALEFLTSHLGPETSFQIDAFAKASRLSVAETASLPLALGITTKLARLIQEQGEREIAINRIASAICNTKEIDSILKSAVTQIGTALNVSSCVVSIAGGLDAESIRSCYFRHGVVLNERALETLTDEIESATASISRIPRVLVIDGKNSPNRILANVTVPLVYRGIFVGILRVTTDDCSRVWSENELTLLKTVAHQLTMAVKQQRLFDEMQEQALTDGLTGSYNRRSFELQLERDLHLATRMRQPLSLVMLDLDNFKQVNERAGKNTGDLALRMLAEKLRINIRAVDTTARFGGDEFAMILPQAAIEGARIVCERLRRCISETEIPGYGSLTASFGFATFPNHASSRDTIIVTADRALYDSKSSGGNRVSGPPEEDLDSALTEPISPKQAERLISVISGRSSH